MKRTPDEIKNGLECCKQGRTWEETCGRGCPYWDNCDEGCSMELPSDALAYIQQLESKLNQVVEDIRMLGRMGQNICPVCANYNNGAGCKDCVKCLIEDGFKWRGLVKEG